MVAVAIMAAVVVGVIAVAGEIAADMVVVLLGVMDVVQLHSVAILTVAVVQFSICDYKLKLLSKFLN